MYLIKIVFHIFLRGVFCWGQIYIFLWEGWHSAYKLSYKLRSFGCNRSILLQQRKLRIQFISRNVRDLYICLSGHIWKPRFPVDCRLLVKEPIANIGIPLDMFWVFAVLMTFAIGFLGFLGFANLPTVHSGGVISGRVCGRWQVTGDTQHMTHDTWGVTPDTWTVIKKNPFFCLFWYWCYYTQTSWDLVSPFSSVLGFPPFTKPPLFQRNRLTGSGNPTFESCVELKAQ